jgi:epoxyqueuosine reductase
MHYLERGLEKRRDSRLPVPGAATAIVVGLNYGGRQAAARVARYARGRDYHRLMERRLRQLARWLEESCGRPLVAKVYVDTGPVLERELAQRAGLGWIGKNTNLINPKTGSFFFLGSLLVDLELESDPPFEADRCGRCRRCLDACPTAAFVAPRTLDARRCISYLTIELRSSIPRQFRPKMGELIFGCDICQEVCPWNVRFAGEPNDPELLPAGWTDPEPAEILRLAEDEFRARFAGTPLLRAGRRGLARNAAVALGNRRRGEDLPVLIAAFQAETDPLVRGHIAWALGCYACPEARAALLRQRELESDPLVIEEIEAALERWPV